MSLSQHDPARVAAVQHERLTKAQAAIAALNGKVVALEQALSQEKAKREAMERRLVNVERELHAALRS